jgi:hypothetical protein
MSSQERAGRASMCAQVLFVRAVCNASLRRRAARFHRALIALLRVGVPRGDDNFLHLHEELLLQFFPEALRS